MNPSQEAVIRRLAGSDCGIGAVNAKAILAALDAERAKVVGLVAALEKAHYSATGGCGLEESEHPESPYHFLFAAIRAAKEGTVPT